MNASRHPSGECEQECDPLLFQDLPTDVLLSIFRYCNIHSLLRLSQTCKRINNIISEDFVWLERSKRVNVSNQVSTQVKNRSFSILHCKDRCRVSQNWNLGRYEETIFLHNKTKYMPWLQLEKDIVWFSRGRQILALKRRANSIATVPALSFKPHKEDVSRFVVKNGKVVSGGRDGSLSLWNLSKNRLLSEEKHAHNLDITGVDFDGQESIVTGSKDERIKVWRLEDRKIVLKYNVAAEDRVWSVAYQSGSNSLLCYGTSGLRPSKCPLGFFDIERNHIFSLTCNNLKRGAGILDILWEDLNTVVTCGYDRMVRMWDIRTLSCVRFWSDPFDVVLYSLASDYNHTLLCGTAQHGRVQMWDKRMTRASQMYFMNSKHSSPSYSLAFDATHLFVALDQSLNMMDFSGFRHRSVAKDYRNFSVLTDFLG
ncbi:F-box/WD repeat-containing protein 4-like isoform X1 [Thrips palmi]|uniref:F-box/WD repeat-containing protein 4-like isoform X1 n=1 Tax=Thrips palmi TaxID=161013 RepID=A0A6P8YIV9_THRPL|nr:F-box/WD repeat-containing protein 4-like isoform X1 [Thrips palmi]